MSGLPIGQPSAPAKLVNSNPRHTGLLISITVINLSHCTTFMSSLTDKQLELALVSTDYTTANSTVNSSGVGEGVVVRSKHLNAHVRGRLMTGPRQMFWTRRLTALTACAETNHRYRRYYGCVRKRQSPLYPRYTNKNISSTHLVVCSVCTAYYFNQKI